VDSATCSEVVNWDAIRVDFVIVGFHKMGTTSVARQLDRIPGIHVVTDDKNIFAENDLFSYRELVPLKRRVLAFNRRNKTGNPDAVRGIKLT